MAKRRLLSRVAGGGLADTGKGTVAKLASGMVGGGGGLADTGKGTVAKLPQCEPGAYVGLADTGKGTVAKLFPHLGEQFAVLPTLEKELWQSFGTIAMSCAGVLPTLEKELWQS